MSFKELIASFYDIGIIKIGDFTLKSGIRSPIYMDIRAIVSYPNLIKELSNLIYGVMDKEVKHLCGVPYTALPIATCIGIEHNYSSLIKRKEKKEYGTKKMVEGVFKEGDDCCVIEDVISSGGSVIETVAELKAAGLIVREVIVIIDRCQGGKKNIEDAGLKLKSLFNMFDILDSLVTMEKISEEQFRYLSEFIKSTQIATPVSLPPSLSTKAAQVSCPTSQKLCQLMQQKQSRLCLAADVESMDQLCQLAELAGPYISVLKVHADVLDDFCVEKMKGIKNIGNKHGFLIMEDRKFGDIGNTIKHQLLCKQYQYLSWCDLITIHANPGDSLLDGVRDALSQESTNQLGCVIVANMSCRGAIPVPESDCMKLANQNKDLIVGFVSQKRLVDTGDESYLYFTPGVKSIQGDNVEGDKLGQQYRSMDSVKKLGFVDVFIVGRAITSLIGQDGKLEKLADQYRKASFYNV